jgi:AAA15 family ATPase/GTPase
MNIIENISIKNFRILRDLNYSPKQINIITGRNNTGKSALLDAIILNVTGCINWEFKDWIIENPIDLITSGEQIAKISSNFDDVQIFANSDTMQTNLADQTSLIFSKILREMKNAAKSGLTKTVFNDETFRVEFFNLFFKYYDIITIASKLGYVVVPYWRKKENSKLFMNELTKLIQTYAKNHLDKLSDVDKQEYRKSDFIRPAIPPSFHLKINEDDDTIVPVFKMTHFDKTVFEDTTDEGLIILEDFINQNNLVKNLKRLSNKNVVYKIDEQLVTIPINAHGDGFISLLNTIQYFIKSRDGVLLIEEPENHLHPGFIEVFIENLFLYCQKLNVQVFMTTHSYDLIQSALKYANSSNQKDVLLVSKMTADEKTIEKLDYTVDEGIKVIDEMFLDLRGN